MTKKSPEEVARGILNASGYPFQMAVEAEIRRTQDKHGWKIRSHEHPWISGSNEEGFIDIVIEKVFEQHVIAQAVIECRRRKDPAWVFPISTERVHKRSQPVLFCMRKSRGMETGWVSCHIDPDPPRAEFCAMQGTRSEDRTLEGWSQDLLTSLKACAPQVWQVDGELVLEQCVWPFVPVIVTNVPLVVCDLPASEVSLETGELPKAGKFLGVDWLCFHKPLDAGYPGEKMTELSDLRRVNERSILVANASKIADVLSTWRFTYPIWPLTRRGA